MTVAIDQWIDGSLTWSELLQILHTHDTGRVLACSYFDGELTFAELLKGLTHVAD